MNTASFGLSAVSMNRVADLDPAAGYGGSAARCTDDEEHGHRDGGHVERDSQRVTVSERAAQVSQRARGTDREDRNEPHRTVVRRRRPRWARTGGR